MLMSPEKIKMFSLTESGSDLASFSPDLGQNEEKIRSKEKPPLPLPASPSDENPELSPNQESHFKEKLPDDSSRSHDQNRNLCANQNKGPVQNPNPCANLKEQVEEHLQMPPTCSDDQSHGFEKQFSFSHVEGEAEKATGKEKAVTAASAVLRKLPVWASNKSSEDEKGRRGKSKIQTENKGIDFPLARNLREVIEAFSGDFDEKKCADMDILEIAEMKGIVFENPSWWPPEGFPDSL